MSNDRTHRSDEDGGDGRRTGPVSGRREYLKFAGTAAISVAGVSAATGSATAAEVGGVEFEHTVNMVEDAGCDPTGGTPCNQAIMEYADDDTLLEFPDGTYLLDTDDETRVVLEGYDSLGLAGVNENVVFEFTSNTDGYSDVRVDDIGEFVYRDIDWDVTAENCAPGFAVRAREYLRIENWEIDGRQDNGGGFALQPGIANADGIGIIENFVATKGSKFETAPRGGVLVSQGRNHGTLRFVDCHLEEFENNGLYAAASAGPIQVEGGVYRNNMRSQLRFSGADSYIENALVEVDVSTISEEAEPEGFRNGRGIWWESKNTDSLKTGGEIRNTEVIIRQGANQNRPNTGGGVVVRRDGGACTIRDSTIRMDVTPRPAVYAKAPAIGSDHPAPPEPHSLVMENVDIVGAAKDLFAVQIEGRPGSEIRGCYFEQRYRYGLVLAGCDDSVIADTDFDITGAPPVAVWGSEDVTIDGAPPSRSSPPVISDSNYDESDDGDDDHEGDDGERGPPDRD